MEYPKVLYKGVFDPESGGLNALEKVTVTSSKEEKDQLKAGFVTADDVESLRAKPSKATAVKASAGGE